MSWRGTLVLVCVAALATSFLLFSQKKQTRSAQEPLLTFDPAQAQRIDIREGASLLSLVKKEGVWCLRGDLSEPADPHLIHSLLETASSTKPTDILKASELKGAVSLAQLELKQPKRSLTIGSGASERIDFGAQGAAPGFLYARLGGGDVYLIPDQLSKLAFHSSEDFRNPRLTPITMDHLTGISLSKAGNIEKLILKKGPSGWKIESPLSAQADPIALSEWITPLLSAQIQQWMPERSDPSSVGLQSPRAIFSLFSEGATNPLIISIGNPVPTSSECSYVGCSDRHGIAIIKGLSPVIDVTPRSLRSHSLKPVDFDSVDCIDSSDHKAGGTAQRFLRKSGTEDWVIDAALPSNNTILPGENVRACFDKLKSIKVENFEPATPERLTFYRMDQETTSLRFSARLSENTAEESAGEYPLVSYTFSAPNKGVIALREGDSSDLMIVPEHPLEEILQELTKEPFFKTPSTAK
jgi:hypothetical protein